MSILDNGEWYEVFIGDEVNNTDVIKLESNSLVEIENNGSSIILNQQGIFPLKDLLIERAITSNIFRKFMAKDIPEQSAAMGVRGSATESDSMEWLVEEDEVIEEVKELIEIEDYEEAINLLEEEIDYAEEINYYNYYLGYSYYMINSLGKAFSYLNKVEVEEDFYGDFVIMMGSLLINSTEYEKALTIFEEYLRDDSYSAEAQVISFMTSVTYKYMGKDEQTKKKLEITIKMDKDSDTGKKAQQLLDTM